MGRNKITNIIYMSIATLKKKTAAKYNNVSVNVPQFSINGGYRNQGWVGQSTLSRSLIKTPYRGATPRGHGGCCGTYDVSIVKPLEPCTNNNSVVKNSVLSTDGMLDTKYRWTRRPARDSQGNVTGFSVKPDTNHNLNTQSDHIHRVVKKNTDAITKNCPPIPKNPCAISCSLFKDRISSRSGIDHFTKDVGPKDQSAYLTLREDPCVTIDTQFQSELNNKPPSTPFGC